MLRLFADSFSAEPTEGKGRACSELIVTMCWSALLTSFHTEKWGFSQKTCQVTAPLVKLESCHLWKPLWKSFFVWRDFFWGSKSDQTRILQLLSRTAQIPLAPTKAKLLVWEELGTDFPLTSLSWLWQEITMPLLFRCFMQSEHSVIKNNDSVYGSWTKIQWYAILCSPQAPSLCCC